MCPNRQTPPSPAASRTTFPTVACKCALNPGERGPCPVPLRPPVNQWSPPNTAPYLLLQHSKAQSQSRLSSTSLEQEVHQNNLPFMSTRSICSSVVSSIMGRCLACSLLAYLWLAPAPHGSLLWLCLHCCQNSRSSLGSEDPLVKSSLPPPQIFKAACLERTLEGLPLIAPSLVGPLI